MANPGTSTTVITVAGGTSTIVNNDGSAFSTVNTVAQTAASSITYALAKEWVSPADAIMVNGAAAGVAIGKLISDIQSSASFNTDLSDVLTIAGDSVAAFGATVSTDPLTKVQGLALSALGNGITLAGLYLDNSNGQPLSPALAAS